MCQVTIIHNPHGIISKQYALDEAGGVRRSGKAGVMSDGTYQVKNVNSLAQLNSVLSPLLMTPYHGVVLGVPKADACGKPAAGAGRLVSRDVAEWLNAQGRAGVVTRTLDCFAWRDGYCILAIDVDAAPVGLATCRALDALLRGAAPMLGSVQILWRGSGSALLQAGGKVVTPFKAHGFMIVPRGDQAAAIIRALAAAGAAAGVSIDVGVVSPEHWVFAAPSVYGSGITQLPIEPFLGGEALVLSPAAADMLTALGTPAKADPADVGAVGRDDGAALTPDEVLRYQAILRLKLADLDDFAAMGQGDRHNAMNRLVVKCAPYVREGLLGEDALRDLVWDASRTNGYAADVGASIWSREFTKSLREGMELGELQALRPVADVASVFGGAGVAVDAASLPAGMQALPRRDQAEHDGVGGRLDVEAVLRDWHARVCAGERSMPDWEAMGTPEGMELFESLTWKGLTVFKRSILAEQKRLQKAAARERFAGSAGDIVKGMNANYAFICDRGGKSFVMWTNEHGEVKFKTVHDFKDMECKHFLVVDDKRVNYAKLWLEHPGRREYDGVVFDPSNNCGDRYYNTWTGLAAQPKQGGWTLLERHVYNILSCKVDLHYQFIIRHAAWCLQNPDKAAEVAVVFRGGQGTGKGFWCSLLTGLFGVHGYETADTNDLTGSFTGHLETCCFLFLDEVRTSKDATVEDKLKHYIASNKLRIHPKGAQVFQAPNRLKIIMATNNKWAVPIGDNDRRFAIFDVSDEHAQSKPYFSALRNEMDNGGIEAFLYDMLHMELGEWHPRWNIPATKAKREQAERSLSVFDDWMLDILESGCLPDATSPGVATSQALLNDLNKLCKIPHALNVFGRSLRQFGAEPVKVGPARTRMWAFPSLDACRERWEAIHGARDWEAATWEGGLGASPEIPGGTAGREIN